MAKDPVTGEIVFGVGCPGEVNKVLPRVPGEDRLQSGGRGRRKNVAGEDFERRGIFAFDFYGSSCAVSGGHFSYGSDLVGVGFLPVETLIEKAKLLRDRNFGNRG